MLLNKFYPLIARITEGNNDEISVKNSKWFKSNVAGPSVDDGDDNEILGNKSRRPIRNADVAGELRRNFANDYGLRQLSRGMLNNSMVQ